MSDFHLVTVRIACVTAESEMAPDDRKVPTEVPVKVDSDVPVGHIADAALDILHEKLPMKRPEDFEFEVWRNGVELHPSRNHESLSLAGKGDLA